MLGINMTQSENVIFDDLTYFVHLKNLIIILSVFVCQRVFLHPLVSATYIPVLKRPVCGFGCKVSVPVFLKFPIFPLPVAQTYIP